MLRVNKEVEALLPPLSEEEYAGLEASIIAHGCMSPVVIWGDIIVDGHHRYKICEKNQIPIKTKTLHFNSVDEAKLWAWQHQEHRRNMTPYQRAEAALQFKPLLVAKGKNSQGQRNDLCPTLDKGSHDTKRELAEIAGISHGTLHKAEYLNEHADDETKQKLRNNETTINREYNRVKNDLKHDEIPVSVDPETGDVLETKTVSRVDLRYLRRDDPETLIMPLMETFTSEYRQKLIFDLLEKMNRHDGNEIVRSIVAKLNSLYLGKV